MKKLTQVQTAYIAASTESPAVLARRFRISRSQCYRIQAAARNGPRVRASGWRKLPAATIALIVASKEPARALSNRYGVSIASIYAWRKAAR